MVFLDLHVGVSRWREVWVTKRNKRIKGIWDATIERETLLLQPDQRRLTYFLDGPADGRKKLPHIFVFHAMFLSGNAFLMSNPPKDYVLVCVNRPGYFGSDPPPQYDYNYSTFASDIEQLADHLGLETFLVAGHSSGGPCALACAAHLSPRRVQAVGILSGDPEYAHEGVPDKRPVNIFCLGWFLPFLLKRILFCLPLARNAIHGLINDFRLETALYTFRTEHIVQPTLVYIGEEDIVIPLHISRHVHERLDNATLRIVPDIGHMGLLRDFILQDFFESLLNLEHQKELAEDMEDSHDDIEMQRRKKGHHGVVLEKRKTSGSDREEDPSTFVIS